MTTRQFVGVMLISGAAVSVTSAQAPAPDPALIRTSPAAYFRQLGEIVRSQLPPTATPKERADRVFAVMDELSRDDGRSSRGRHEYPINKSLLGRVQGLPSSAAVGTCGWWAANMREAFLSAGIPKASILVLESHVKDPAHSGGAVADAIVDTAHDLANVNNVHQSVAIVDGTLVRTYDVWQDGADLDRQSASTTTARAISFGSEKGRLASEWFGRQVTDGRPFLAQDGVPLARSLIVLKTSDAALALVNDMTKTGKLRLAPGVTPAQVAEWLNGQALLGLTQQSRVDPGHLAALVSRSRLAAATPQTATESVSAGCWEKASAPSEVSEITPPGRGVAGTGSASSGSVSLETHPADPKWSFRVTGGLFTWNFGAARPARLCAGTVLSGSATFSNSGAELNRAGYSPSGSLRVEMVGSSGVPQTAGHLYQLSSADLPAPGQTVTRPFTYKIPPASAPGQQLRFVAEVYAGRLAKFTEVYHWVAQ